MNSYVIFFQTYSLVRVDQQSWTSMQTIGGGRNLRDSLRYWLSFRMLMVQRPFKLVCFFKGAIDPVSLFFLCFYSAPSVRSPVQALPIAVSHWQYRARQSWRTCCAYFCLFAIEIHETLDFLCLVRYFGMYSFLKLSHL